MIETVAVVSTGVIGASWASAFLAAGLDVVATDPAPNAEAALRQAVDGHWPVLERLGLAPGAAKERLRFVPTAEEAVAGAGFLQESGPEQLDLKQALFARLDAVAPPDTILASSTSTLAVSDIQARCQRRPERVVLGHPFNPPHLIPLVEVVGGRATGEAAIERAISFYRDIGKHPIRLRRETPGHVANRLQAALWQEAIHLVQSGVASVADVDAAIAHGPGLRWALLGPFLNLHLSGGAAGIAGLFEKPLWRATEELFRDLSPASVDPDTATRIADGVAEELAGIDRDALVRDRDAALIALLRAKLAGGALP